MKVTLPIFASLALFTSSTALADTVPVYLDYMSYATNVTFEVTIGSTTSVGTHSAGQMALSVDGALTPAYCVDLGNYVYYDQVYYADLVPVEMDSYWCEVNYILENFEADSANEAAAIQLAIWSLIYDVNDIQNSTIAARVAEILAASSGSCPLTCDEVMGIDVEFEGWHDGFLYATGSLFREDGSGIGGEQITLAVSNGVLDDTVVFTENDGSFAAAIDMAGYDETEITAYAYAQNLLMVDPTTAIQELISFIYGEACTYEDSDSWSEVTFGDPRTIGFWKHQTRGKGAVQVDTAILESWLPITIFDTTYTTVDEMNTALWITGKDKQAQALQQCLATYLNVAWGQAGWFNDIDLDGDGTAEAQLWEYWQQAEGFYNAGDGEPAKTICDTFNNL